MAINVDVWLTHDNTFSLQIKDDGSVVDLISAGVDRMVISSSVFQIDSDEEGEGAGQPFDWATSGVTGITIFSLGDVSVLIAGTYLCTLTIFDTLHTDGQVWDDLFHIVVHDAVVD